MSVNTNQRQDDLETSFCEPQELSLDENGNLIMNLGLDGKKYDSMRLEDFLDLTDIERHEIENYYRPLWYTLVCDKIKSWMYPDYFRLFHDKYSHLFSWSNEMKRERDPISWENLVFPDRANRELVFVRLNLPITNKKIGQEVMNTQNAFEKILWDLPKRFI